MRTKHHYRSSILVFSLLWAIVFVIYLPAAKAGFVADFTGWLNSVKNESFGAYINRTNFYVHSLYQFTQFTTYIFYKLFGIHEWLWHLLHITMHAINAFLLFKFCTRLLDDAGTMNSKPIAFSGTLLFCLSPYVCEPIVWEPAYHFLQGLTLILIILVAVQEYIHTGLTKYIWLSITVYFLSTYSLEVFYITPWLVAIVLTFYRLANEENKKLTRLAAIYIFIPLLLLLGLHFIIYHIVYGSWLAHTNPAAVISADNVSFGNPAKYIFHILFLGRFLPEHTRHTIYAICDLPVGIAIFYAALLLIIIFITVRFRRMSGKAKVAGLLFIFSIITLGDKSHC